MISAHDLLTTQDCTVYLCPNEAEFGGLCRYHERRRLEVAPAPSAELELDRQERDRQERRMTGGAASGRTHAQPWSREEIIRAIRAYIGEHGKPPSAYDWKSINGLPSYPTACKVFGSTAAAIEAAELSPAPPSPAPERDAPAIAGDGNGNGASEELSLVERARRVEELVRARDKLDDELEHVRGELESAISDLRGSLEAA